MYTATIDTKHGERLFQKTYFDYTKQEVLNMAKRFFNEKITREEAMELGIKLSVYRNGEGGAFPFGCYGKEVYYGVPKQTKKGGLKMEVYGVQWKYRDNDDSQYDADGTLGDLFDNRSDAERLLREVADSDYQRWLTESKYDKTDAPEHKTDAKTGTITVEYCGSVCQYWVQAFNLNLKTKGAQDGSGH